MHGRVAVRVLLAVGSVAAVVAYAAWTADRTAFDAEATEEVARALLDAQAVQESLVDEIEAQVAAAAPELTADPATAEALSAALRDPRFVDAFGAAVGAVHAQLLDGSAGGGPVTLDAGEVTAAVSRALEPHDPELAARVAQRDVVVDLGDGDVPDLSAASSRTSTAMAVGTLLALLCFGTAVAIDPDPRWPIARIGRRLALLAIGPVVGFVLLPWLLGATSNDAAGVAAEVLRVYRAQVVPSAVVLAVGGLGMWAATRRWPRVRELDGAVAAGHADGTGGDRLYL